MGRASDLGSCGARPPRQRARVHDDHDHDGSPPQDRLLRRRKDGNAFLYEPAMDHAEYQKRVVEAALTPLLEQGASPVLAAFVEIAADLDESHLAELEKLIASHRRRK